MREAEVTRVRATSIGFVFQTFNLIPTLSAQENVEAALVPLHVSASARRKPSINPCLRSFVIDICCLSRLDVLTRWTSSPFAAVRQICQALPFYQVKLLTVRPTPSTPRGGA